VQHYDAAAAQQQVVSSKSFSCKQHSVSNRLATVLLLLPLAGTKDAALKSTHTAAAASGMTLPATDSKPVNKQQELSAAAERGGFGRGSFGRGGNYGPSYWSRRLQGDEQPLLSDSKPVQKEQQEAAAAAERGGFGRGSFGRGGNYGPSYWGRRLQGDEQPLMDSATGTAGQKEAAAAAERGGFGRGSFGRGGNYGPSYWGRRLQGECHKQCYSCSGN
jgi:hypothetical protein